MNNNIYSIKLSKKYSTEQHIKAYNKIRLKVEFNLPGYAFDKISIFKNTSNVFSEYLTERLELLPFTKTTTISKVWTDVTEILSDQLPDCYPGILILKSPDKFKYTGYCY